MLREPLLSAARPAHRSCCHGSSRRSAARRPRSGRAGDWTARAAPSHAGAQARSRNRLRRRSRRTPARRRTQLAPLRAAPSDRRAACRLRSRVSLPITESSVGRPTADRPGKGTVAADARRRPHRRRSRAGHRDPRMPAGDELATAVPSAPGPGSTASTTTSTAHPAPSLRTGGRPSAVATRPPATSDRSTRPAGRARAAARR